MEPTGEQVKAIIASLRADDPDQWLGFSDEEIAYGITSALEGLFVDVVEHLERTGEIGRHYDTSEFDGNVLYFAEGERERRKRLQARKAVPA